MSLNITLIDDDPMTRTMLEDYIREKYPFAILSSWPTGEVALKNMNEIQDLVIMDYHLDSVSGGSLNGIEIFKKIKTKFPSLPVIFISGQDESKIAASTLLHGAHDYITKNENLFQRLDASLTSLFGKTDTSTKSKGPLVAIIVLLLALIGIALASFLMND